MGLRRTLLVVPVMLFSHQNKVAHTPVSWQECYNTTRGCNELKMKLQTPKEKKI